MAKDTAVALNDNDDGQVTRYTDILGAGIADVIQENVGETITPFDFERVKVPAGGGTQWRIDTLEGEEERKEIRGVIVGWRDTRAMWRDTFDNSGGGGTPPDCSSQDGITGVGDPGGDCHTCPFNEWGSAGEGSRGKACKELKALFVVTPESELPYLFLMPPTSRAAVKTYMLRLAAKRKPHWYAETLFTLERTKNNAGIQYSRLKLQLSRWLDDDEIDAATLYKNELTPVIESSAIEVTSSDYVDPDDVPFD